MILKEYVIIYDSQGEQFDIWTSKEYDRYIESTLSVGACPAVSLVTHFDKNDSLLKGKDEPYTMSAGTWVQASDRLPKQGKHVVIKEYSGVLDIGWYSEAAERFHTESDLVPLSIHQVYWLDEAASPAGDGWKDKYLSEMTDIMRDADKLFEQGGGGTRHYMRGLFEIMEENGFAIVRLPTPPNKSV